MFKLYKKYLFKQYRLHLIFGPFFKILEAICELIVPLIIKYMIDDIVNNPIANDKVMQLWQCGAILFAFAIGGFSTTIIAQYIAAKASQGFGTTLRNELYMHINSLSFKELDKISSSSLINRLDSDVINTQSSVAMLIRLVLRAPFIVIGATIMSFIVNGYAGLVFLGATILLFAIIFFVTYYIVPLSKRAQNNLDNTTKISKENLSGNRVVRAFNKQKQEFVRFVDNQNTLYKIQTKIASMQAYLDPATFLLVNAASLLVCFICANQFINHGITQGDIQALMNYFVQIQIAVVAVTDLVLIFTRASASAHRINEVFDLHSSLSYGDIDHIDDNRQVLAFNDVTFTYNKGANPALNHISFDINKGESVGIIGGTGSGKTSIINLINHFYEADSGTISFYGKDIKLYQAKVINKEIATVMQKAVLFNGSIKDNLLKGRKDASDEDINNALKVAQASDFVSYFPNDINYQIYQGGKNLSGGQRQRLSIARALVKNAPILILDDSSSALDYQTEAHLRRAIQELHKTTIIISQRVLSVMNLDKIIVMDKGKLVAIGKHQDLYNSSDIYREICQSQDIGESVCIQ